MAYAHGLISNPHMPAVVAQRELTMAELAELPKHRGVGARRLKNIRAIHHKIARMMAAGCANVEIAAAVGFHQSRISILRHDPAFAELLAHYHEVEYDNWQDVRERAALLGVTAAEVIQDRLIENPDSVPTKDLLGILEKGLDYGGHRPAQRNENLHVHTTQEQIERAKAGRAENVSVRGSDGGDDSAGDTIEGEIISQADCGPEVREEGADGDSPEGEDNPESVAGLLGL